MLLELLCMMPTLQSFVSLGVHVKFPQRKQPVFKLSKIIALRIKIATTLPT